MALTFIKTKVSASKASWTAFTSRALILSSFSQDVQAPAVVNSCRSPQNQCNMCQWTGETEGAFEKGLQRNDWCCWIVYRGCSVLPQLPLHWREHILALPLSTKCSERPCGLKSATTSLLAEMLDKGTYPKPDNLRVHRTDPFSDGVFKYSEISNPWVGSRSDMSHLNIIPGPDRDDDGTHDVHLYPSLHP